MCWNRSVWALVAAGLLCVTLPVQAANAFVQSASGVGNDPTITFGAAPLAANRVFVLTMQDSEGQTTILDGWAGSVTTLTGPTNSVADTMRFYAFCLVPDGADTAFVATTSGSSIVAVVAAEVSGSETTCASTLDDATDLTTDTALGTSHAMATPLTTSVAGDFILGMIRVFGGTANWTATGDTDSIDTGDAEIAGGSTSTLGWYKVAGAAGTEDVTYTSAASETGYLAAIAIKPLAGGGPPGGGGAGTKGEIFFMGIGR